MNITAINNHITIAQNYYKTVEGYYRKVFQEDSFEKVIQLAAEAQVPNNDIDGRTFFADHQYRVGKYKCKLGSMELITPENLYELENAKSFEDIFKVTEKVKKSINGLGDLWSYDTSQRIAFGRGFYPKDVYLQRGAKEGVKQLVNSGMISISNVRGKRHVSGLIFPPELSRLEPFLIENILCVGNRRGWFNNLCK